MVFCSIKIFFSLNKSIPNNLGTFHTILFYLVKVPKLIECDWKPVLFTETNSHQRFAEPYWENLKYKMVQLF